MPNPWEALEAIPGLIAVPAVWQRRMGAQWPAFRQLCFDVTSQRGQWVPCPRDCGCHHRVEPQSDGSLLAFCVCEDPRECRPFPVALADVAGLQLNARKLARELCRAFSLASKYLILPPPNTVQVGSWSAGAIPVILTVQVWRSVFRRAVAELVARLNAPFILFAPTSDQFDVHSQELLARVRAAFFPLDSTVVLTEAGTLLPARAPGELFAQFTPEPEPDNQQLLISVVALVHRLEAIKTARPPSILRVFERRYLDRQTNARIAKEFACSRSTVRNRLRAIKRTLGDRYQGFERYAPHFRKILDQFSDPRAKAIYLKGLFNKAPASEDSAE